MLKYLYMGIIHITLVVVCIYAYNKTKSFNKLEIEYKDADVRPFSKPNEIIKYVRDSTVQHSKPYIAQEDVMPISTKKLLDSVSEIIKMPSNGRITGYAKVPISSSITAKATKVTDTLAEYENENWYLSYNLKDSVFNGRYKTFYNQANYNYRNSTLGISTGKLLDAQASWLTDKNAKIGATSSVVIKPTKNKPSLNISNVNKFRSLDNSLLSGGEVSYTKGRNTIGGQYMYNFNTKKPEWEIQYKFGIVK